MLKVFLIDDENLILKGLQCLIDWEANGFTVIGSFTRAQEAIDAASKTCPDLIITDIRMPKISGLDLISQLKHKLPQTLFVILTAYDSFDYAQKGLNLGAFHYLLKPIDRQELLNVLTQARQRVEASKGSFSGSADQIYRESFSIRDFLLHGFCLSGGSSLSVPENLKRQIKVKLLFWHLPIELNEKFSYDLISENDYQTIYQIIEERCHPLAQFMVQGFYVAAIKKNCRVSIKEIEEEIKQKTALSPLLYLTSGSTNLTEGHLFLENETEMFQRIVFFEQPVRHILPEKDIFNSTEFYQKRLLTCLNHLDYEGIGEVFTDLFFELQPDEKTYERDQVIRIYWSFLNLIRQYCNELNPNYSLTRPIVPLESFLRHKDVSDYVLEFIQHETKSLREYFPSNKASLAARVKMIIDTSFADPDLKLSLVAERLFINYSYLSHLFNSVQGISFNQYLTRVRLTKAKSMLVSSSQPVTDIARQVGYSDTKNFFRVFKKQTGVSPQQYRKGLNKNQNR